MSQVFFIILIHNLNSPLYGFTKTVVNLQKEEVSNIRYKKDTMRPVMHDKSPGRMLGLVTMVLVGNTAIAGN